jgi:hypothetical protein
LFVADAVNAGNSTGCIHAKFLLHIAHLRIRWVEVLSPGLAGGFSGTVRLSAEEYGIVPSGFVEFTDHFDDLSPAG